MRVWRGRGHDRARRRAMPTASSILWRPLRDSHYVLAALQPDRSGLRQLFVRQSVLVQTQSLARPMFSDAPLGLLLGRQWECPTTGVKYITVDSIRPAKGAASDVTTITRTLRGLLDQDSRDRSVECVGWYSGSQSSDCRLTGVYGTVHAALFPEPWQTAFVIGEQASAGAFYLYDVRNTRWYVSPFYELGDEKAKHDAPKTTCISWPTYLTTDDDAATRPMPVPVSQARRSPALELEREPLRDGAPAASPAVGHQPAEVPSVSRSADWPIVLPTTPVAADGGVGDSPAEPLERKLVEPDNAAPAWLGARPALGTTPSFLSFRPFPSLGALGRFASGAVRAVAKRLERDWSERATAVVTIRKPELDGARAHADRQRVEAVAEPKAIREVTDWDEATPLEPEVACDAEEQEDEAVWALQRAAREKAARLIAEREAAARALEEQEEAEVQALQRAAQEKAARVLAEREQAERERAERERAERDVAERPGANKAAEERVMPWPSEEFADWPASVDFLAVQQAANHRELADRPIPGPEQPARAFEHRAISRAPKADLPPMGDLEDTRATDQPYRFLALARREGFVVSGNRDRGTSDRPETVWVLNEPELGLKLTVVTSDEEVCEATLEYAVAGDHTTAEIVRESCREGLRARCRRLREMGGQGAERVSAVKPAPYARARRRE